MGTLQLTAIEEQGTRLPSWSVSPPSPLLRPMLMPGTGLTATPTAGTTTGWATTTGTCTTTGTDLVCRRDTGSTTARGPLRPSPRLMLMPGTGPTDTPTTGETTGTSTTTTGTCTATCTTDPATPSTEPSTTRGPLTPRPSPRLTPGTSPTATPTGGI